ncbi:phage tail spike protein [Companilactobacillus nodensis]|uniref:Minor structural protein n=1 Tax=Companilactobacillus nodensis DSM 19682 = JCM 14932 = NBRC 107160 TaxID=1423775 RepID=A0A0R1K543_9LACO|nr:phage tail spike protein [Companilactobacillus nodensis]KRK78476.1 minor structural protein [Companilactobacillus nodensis DSM 19682 = JCM 14932 = NBRC 107160]
MSYLKYPVLFESSESDFTTQGIGVLTDCLNVEVTNEFNELPELKLDYLATGDIANELKKGRIIVADVGENYLKQRFRIDDVKKSLDNKIEVTATHILNDLSYNTLKQNINASAVTPVTAFNLLKRNLEQPEPSLVMKSNITTSTNIDWSMTAITNAKKALGGAKGSLLQIFKGEYLFDNYTIHYERTIGTKTGKVIQYGKDLIQARQEENISETYSAIKPFSKTGSDSDEKIVYLPERIIKANSTFEKLRVLTKDFSQDKIETIDQLRSRTNRYISDNRVGIPKVYLTFEIADIKDDLGFVDELKMGDEVTVYFANLNIDTTARVIKTVWDGLLHRYKTVSIGDKPTTTSDYQSNQNEHIDTVDKNVTEVSKDVSDLKASDKDKQQLMDELKKKVSNTRDDMLSYINGSGRDVIRFLPDRENPTDIVASKNGGNYGMRWNSKGIYYDGKGTVAIDNRGNVYADKFVGQSITGVHIRGGEISGVTISGDTDISLGSGSTRTSVTRYGISTPNMTVNQIDGLKRMDVSQYADIGGANLWGDGSGKLYIGPYNNFSNSVRVVTKAI